MNNKLISDIVIKYFYSKKVISQEQLKKLNGKVIGLKIGSISLIIGYIIVLLGTIKIIHLPELNLVIIPLAIVTIFFFLFYLEIYSTKSYYFGNDKFNVDNIYKLKRHKILKKLKKYKIKDLEIIDFGEDIYILNNGIELKKNELFPFFMIDNYKYCYSKDLKSIFYTSLDVCCTNNIATYCVNDYVSIIKNYYYLYIHILFCIFNILSFISIIGTAIFLAY